MTIKTVSAVGVGSAVVCTVLLVAAVGCESVGAHALATSCGLGAVLLTEVALFCAGWTWADRLRERQRMRELARAVANAAINGMKGPPRHAVDAVSALNEALRADPLALQQLLAVRVPCTEELGRHPSVQVMQEADGSRTVGVLGLINGCLGVIDGGPLAGWGWVTCVLEDGRPVRFECTLTPPKVRTSWRGGR